MSKPLILVGVVAMICGLALAAMLMLRSPDGPSTRGGERQFSTEATSPRSEAAGHDTGLAWLAGLLAAAGGGALVVGVGRWRSPRRRGKETDEYVNPSINSDDPRRVI